MTLEELKTILSAKTETERIEFKEAKEQISILGNDAKGNRYNRKSLYGYAVAIGNEGGGFLILGVTDKIDPKLGHRRIVGSRAIQNTEKAKSEIFRVLGRRIEIQEHNTMEGKVQIVVIPSRPVGAVFKFHDIPLMRSSQELVPMDDGTLKRILTEVESDYSAQIIHGANMDDLDPKALELLRSKFAEKSGRKEYNKLSDLDLLNKLLLLNKGKITLACLLLAGSQDSLARFVPSHEIFMEWRTKNTRLEFDQRQTTRKAYLLAEKEIWDFVNARNSRYPIKKGFFEFDIWSYDQDSVREAALNGFAHREYRGRTDPLYIRVSPDSVIVKSAGGFVPGVSVENILDVEGRWRNPLLMDILSRIGLVERAGIGIDRIFKKTVSDGKGLPSFAGTDSEQVILTIPAQVRDSNFVYYLEKISRERQLDLDAKDLIALETIRSSGRTNDKQRIKFFLENGIIEKTGSGKGTKYFPAKDFYVFIDKKSEYTRKRWLSKEQQKEVLLNYFRQHKKGQMSDFRELFENKLTKIQINSLLIALKNNSLIYFEGPQRSKNAYWRLR